jgi:hypothetical protein
MLLCSINSAVSGGFSRKNFHDRAVTAESVPRVLFSVVAGFPSAPDSTVYSNLNDLSVLAYYSHCNLAAFLAIKAHSGVDVNLNPTIVQK